jgi:beta-glucosidase-like glycosyl hydrolase
MKKVFATTEPNQSPREIRNAQRSRAAAAQGIVLLQNNGVLPLSKIDKIALFGGGIRNTVKGGTGSGDVSSREVIHIEQALEEAGFTVTTKPWLDRLDIKCDEARNDWKKRLIAAKEADSPDIVSVLFSLAMPNALPIEKEDLVPDRDTAIYVLSRNSGEGADRRAVPADYYLEEGEIANLQTITAAYKNVVVVLNVGGVIDTKPLRAMPGIGGIVLLSQGGCMVGHALVDVLTGKVIPSGHLTTTWAESYEDYPNSKTYGATNGNLDDEFYNEGIYVGYRYFDTFGVAPAYPFGFGLSYTAFSVETKAVGLAANRITVSAQVTNMGSTYSGKEVVQIYYSAPAGKLEKPYQELAAYAKTKELAPGESQTLQLSFSVEDMASYSEADAAYLLEAGIYYIRVGTHSRATHVVAALQLKTNLVTQCLSNHLQPHEPVKELSNRNASPFAYAAEAEEKSRALVLEIAPEDVPCVQTAPQKRPVAPLVSTAAETITLADVRSKHHTLDELLAQLSNQELAALCVGADRNVVQGAIAIGNSSRLCPGAAGGTTPVLENSRGIRSLIFADGPAGLRLVTEFFADRDGNFIASASSVMPEGLDKIFDVKQPEIPADAVQHYQYATAIPIATCLAQSWDLALLTEVGSIVSEEMQELGVDLWLAPGMNIHRNPLCGRNFEYYSEDPLVSGLCAAAMTKGVQTNGAVGTTIKHFALNNQEDNRNFVNSIASERTIREIYLKGFEIAIRQSAPLALMTSYNLLNGTHTANCRDLLTAIVRDEWGYQGLIMTDWGTTGTDTLHKYGCSNAAGCIAAGNDLTMPGSPNDVAEILCSIDAAADAVRYSITRSDLQACAKHVLQTLLYCTPQA